MLVSKTINEDLTTAEYAYSLDKNIKETKRQLNYNFLTLGYLLHLVKSNEIYKVLDYPSFNSYISQPELSIKRSTAYKLVGIYEKFVVDLKVSHDRLLDIDYGKLDLIRTDTNEANLDDMLGKAESLSRSDLQAELTGEEHKYERFCPHCNQKVDKLIVKEIVGEDVYKNT